ncbi:hypothetical protein ACIBG8_48260 [Nonomuraea sp. NPDC050556]|uniref:hypothetical protein n=1 Tax=Nonomuraea sp. NPDC050556 TaxID=3364369 RepID=UPI0037904F36
MTRTLASCALVMFLGGCAATTGQAAQPVTAGKEQLRESSIADCMKASGFTYVSTPRTRISSDPDGKRAAGDYAAMKTHRTKYGFMIFSALVYPKDEKAGGLDTGAENPNDRNVRALSAAQQGAYRKARDACFSQATKQIFGKDVKSFDDYYAKYAKAYETTVLSRLDSDPELVPLAQKYADCLKSQGVRVDSAKPSAIGEQAQKPFYDELFALGRKEHPKSKAENWWPSFTPAEARPYLNREVKAALADLECGKDFFPVLSPKRTAASAAFDADWGMS